MTNRTFLSSLLVLLVAALVGCNGPTLLMAGGELDGPVEPAPEDWSTLAPFGTVQLETNPSDPYSVNLAGMLVDGVPQLNAGDSETTWVKHMAADPQVRLRVHGKLYELRATRITDRAGIERFAAEWMKQGSWARDPTKLDVVWIYRLDPR